MSSYTLEYGTFSSGLSLTYGDSLTITGGTATETTLDGAVANINSGLLESTTMSGASMYVSRDAVVSDTVMSGGSLVASGGRIENITLEMGGAFLSAAYSATVTGATVNSGGNVWTYASSFNSAVVNRGGRLSISGGMVNDLNVTSSGSVQFISGTINGATVSDRGYVDGSAGTGTLYNVVLDGGLLYISGGYHADGTVVNDSATFGVSGGTATNTVVNGGSMWQAGGQITGVTVNMGGYYSAGFHWYGTQPSYFASDVVENGGTVDVGTSSIYNYETGERTSVSFPVTFKPNTFRDLFYSTGANGTVHSGTTAVNITARNGGLTVFDGGIVTGFTTSPNTYVKTFTNWSYGSAYDPETDDYDYFSSSYLDSETVTENGNLTVLAGGTVTGLAAQTADENEYYTTYLNFQIAPGTVISGTVDGVAFATENGVLADASAKNVTLTYLTGATASNVSQINGNASFASGVIASGLNFSGTDVSFSRGAVADGVNTFAVPYSYWQYQGGWGDKEGEDVFIETTRGAHLDVSAGATVTNLDMDSQSYLRVQVAPVTVLKGTSGGVAVNISGGVFADASLGSTYVEVIGSTVYDNATGTYVEVGAGTVSNLIVNPGAVVTAADEAGVVVLNMVENGGAVWLGWDEKPEDLTSYSFASNTFSCEHLECGEEGGVTVHKNTIARDNIMFGGNLGVFSGGVVSNFYTVGSGMFSNHGTFYSGAIVSNFDTVRYSDPGNYHPGNFDFNEGIDVNVARLTDYDGLTLFVNPETNITNGSIDDVPFSVEGGVLSGFHGSDTGVFSDTIGIYRGARMIDCRTDQWANVNIWQGASGSNNTFVDGYVYVGSRSYEDESEEGGIALLEKTTLGVEGNSRKSATLYIQDYGVVRDITVNRGSEIQVGSGGKLTGKIRKGSAEISVSYGGVIDFDITAQDALAEARIDSLWNVSSDARYSITIDGTNQAAGTYVLADATYFNDVFFYDDNAVIYFDLMDVSGSTFGYFYAAQERQYHYDEETGDEWYENAVAINYVATSREQQPDFGFSLSEGKRYVDDGAYYTTLLFTVDSNNAASEWVVAPTVTADVATFTTSDVVLSVEYSADSVLWEYSYDGQIWQAFDVPVAQDGTGTPVTMTGDDGTATTMTGGAGTAAAPVATLTVTENGTYFFRGASANGVVSDETSFRVSNIDKVAPTAPADLDAVATEDGVRLSWAESSDDYSGIRKYIVTYKEAGSDESFTVETPYKFFDITAPVPNGTAADGVPGRSVDSDDPDFLGFDPSDYEWSVQAVDYAGNVSDATEYFNGIPGPVASASITTPTNGAVNVVIGTLNPDVAQYEYSLDDQKTWNRYDLAGVVVSENLTVWFRGITVNGEYTKTTFIKIDNIDLIPPEAPIVSASTTEPTNSYVTVTATFSNDSVTRECSADGINWFEYSPNGISFTENGKAFFRGYDAAGNVSPVAEYEVTNIDTVPPDAPTVSIAGADAFAGLLVSGVFSRDSVVREYSLDGKTWEPYKDAIPVMEVGTVIFFRGTDAAGNVSKVTEYTVTSLVPGPVAPTVSADVTVPTTGNVTVSAVFGEDSAVREYSLDGQTWSEYSEPVLLTENGTVYFRGTNDTGSTVTSYEVTNIDRVAPDAPVAFSRTQEVTNQDLAVFATFSDDSVVQEYSFDGANWEQYSPNGVMVSENGMVFFRATDAAGNVSGVTSYEVTNIDKVPPAAPTVALSAAASFNGLLVAGVFSDDSVVQEYSLDGQTWQAYTDAVPVMEVGTVVYFRGTDAAGNVSAVTEYVVNSLIPGPAAPGATADITAPTQMDVTVSATFGEDCVVREYHLDGQTWQPYTGPVTLTDNGSVYFRGTNADGYTSDETRYDVTNIDRVAPDAPVVPRFPAPPEPTNQDVVVTATFSVDSVSRQYSLDGVNWADYPETGVGMSGNGTVYFRGIDAAGNISEVTSYEVANIDKTAPSAPTISADITTPTRNWVVLTATFSDDSAVQEYSFDGENWQEYRGSVWCENNGIVYFRGADAAGNISEIASYEVANIDREAPAAPVVSQDITDLTNKAVTLTANFSEDSVVKQYRYDIMNWMDYSEPLVITENCTVSFRAVDAAGNESVTVSHEVTNIDVIPPEAPRVSADVTEDTDGIVTVSATFSDDSVVREYSLDGETWQEYTDPIRFERNGMVWFRGIDEVGNISDANYTVDNIYEPVDQESYADNGWNDWGIDKVTGAINEELNEVYFASAYEIKDEILLDKKHSIDVDGWQNFVGTDEVGNVDAKDFVRVHIDENMRLCFTVTAKESAFCTLVALTQSIDKYGRVVLSIRNLLFSSLKKDKTTGLYSYMGNIQLENEMSDGTKYFISVDPSNKKKSVFYNVEFDKARSEFYRYGNNDDDGGPEEGEFNEICMDENLYVEGWVGFGDTVDFYKFTLDHAAKLSFGVAAGTYLSFDLYEPAVKNGKQTLKKKGKTLSLKSELVEMPTRGTTDYVTLDPGEYYFSVKSNNVTKCGEEEYNYIIRLMPDSVFYGDGDDGWNNWVARSVSKKEYELNAEITEAEDIPLDEIDGELHLDREGAVEKNYTSYDSSGIETDDVYVNYVGVGDLIDYKKVSLNVAANLCFSVHASDAAMITIYRLEQNKLGAYSLKSLQSTKAKYDKTAGEYQAKTKRLLLDAGDYYISMQTSKKSEAYYNVFVYDNEDDRDHSTVFFREAVGGGVDDWADMATKGAASDKIGEIVELSQNHLWVGDGWVGYGDPIDYSGFTIDGPAKLVFDVAASDRAKFTVYSLEEKKPGKYSLKTVMAVSLKVNKDAEYADEKYTAETKALLLTTPGTYYVSVQSPNASSGGNAYYSIVVDGDKSAFFDEVKQDDSGNDNWKTINASEEKKHVITQTGTMLEGWVGYGDAVDYYGFSLENNTNVVFTVTATDEASFTLSAYTERRGKVSLKVVQKKTSLKYNSATGLYEFSMKRTMLSKDTLYYITMESTNAKKGGSADYTVAVDTFQPSLASALTMPEEASSDVLQDNLFACQSADVLADSALANGLDDETARRLDAELNFLA